MSEQHEQRVNILSRGARFRGVEIDLAAVKIPEEVPVVNGSSRNVVGVASEFKVDRDRISAKIQCGLSDFDLDAVTVATKEWSIDSPVNDDVVPMKHCELRSINVIGLVGDNQSGNRS